MPDAYLGIFHDSYERCRTHPKFFDVFYDRFLNSSQEIQEIFNGVDVDRVKLMVRDALIFVLMASDGSKYAVKRLRGLARYHDDRSVREDHYVLWLEALMSAVEEFDPRYDQEVDAAWRRVMGVGLGILGEPANG